jgi:hypothetical protein
MHHEVDDITAARSAAPAPKITLRRVHKEPIRAAASRTGARQVFMTTAKFDPTSLKLVLHGHCFGAINERAPEPLMPAPIGQLPRFAAADPACPPSGKNRRALTLVVTSPGHLAHADRASSRNPAAPALPFISFVSFSFDCVDPEITSDMRIEKQLDVGAPV